MKTKPTKQAPTKGKKDHMVVYSIHKRGNDPKFKDAFVRCGAGFPNGKDGSITVILNNIPYSNKLNLRAPMDAKPCWKAIPEGQYEVYEPTSENKGKRPWTRVGRAYGNSDETLNIYLDLIPNGRRLNVRLPKEVK